MGLSLVAGKYLLHRQFSGGKAIVSVLAAKEPSEQRDMVGEISASELRAKILGEGDLRATRSMHVRGRELSACAEPVVCSE